MPPQMATPDPPRSSPSESQPQLQSSQPHSSALSHQAPTSNTLTPTTTLQNYTSLTALLVCPLLIALPPRKFDFYTVLLLTGTAVSGDHLLCQYTERGGIAERARRRFLSQHERELGREQQGTAAAAVERQWQGDENEVDRRVGLSGGGEDDTGTRASSLPVSQAVQELRRAGDAAGGQQWNARLGGRRDLDAAADVDALRGRREKKAQKADWKAARDAREREALGEGGRGYGGLIMDQIWEVWSWGREKGPNGDDDGEMEENRRRRGENGRGGDE